MNPAYISALAALAGAAIGGLTSFTTSWLTQRVQLRHTHSEMERTELKSLYNDFIAEASRLFVDALTHQNEDVSGLVGLYAMVGRMRLISDQTVVSAAMQVEDVIIQTYLGPNRTLSELIDYAHHGGLSFLVEFSEACRKDLVARTSIIR